MFQLYPWGVIKLEHSCIYDSHKLCREPFSLANKDDKFSGCFKACITLRLSSTFFSLLSFTLLNNELAAMEILFEPKLL